MEEARADRWLWGIRLYKTRSLATDACRGGHVKINGTTAKPAATVKVGDRVVAHAHGRERVFEVTGIVDKRVAAPVAATCFVDHSPPPPERDDGAALIRRDASTGRPTKRDRRLLDSFFQEVP